MCKEKSTNVRPFCALAAFVVVEIQKIKAVIVTKEKKVGNRGRRLLKR